MIVQRLKWRAASAISFAALRFDSSRERFICPICSYSGVFLDTKRETGNRKHALCPKCRLLERHRLQWLAVQQLRTELDFSKLRVLHIAPEKFISKQLRSLCASYISADLYQKGVDRREDLTQMSFPDGSFDLVYCSHVLEHIKNDLAAISEVRRVLTTKGIAILPVPIVSDVTVEYAAPNPHESDHVRAPGVDYFDRFKPFFRDVRVISSGEFDSRYQLYTYEDRTCWPTPTLPGRMPSSGLKHPDYVPICRVA
jgi:SAM-dependent methyltransferase